MVVYIPVADDGMIFARDCVLPAATSELVPVLLDRCMRRDAMEGLLRLGEMWPARLLSPLPSQDLPCLRPALSHPPR